MLANLALFPMKLSVKSVLGFDVLGGNKPLLVLLISKAALAEGVVVPMPTFCACKKNTAKKFMPTKKNLIIHFYLALLKRCYSYSKCYF